VLNDFIDEYAKYKIIGDKALKQVPDSVLNQVIATDNNSIAILVRHISGNLISRFTDFLTTDGEKPWRNRDSEFEDADYNRESVQKMWTAGWDLLESELAKLSDEDLSKTVFIRGHAMTVHAALSRSLAHTAHHIGQIVLLARIHSESPWQWISIPKGGSATYNKNPTMEKKPE